MEAPNSKLVWFPYAPNSACEQSTLLQTHGFVHPAFKDAAKILRVRQTSTADVQLPEPTSPREALEAGGPQELNGRVPGREK